MTKQEENRERSKVMSAIVVVVLSFTVLSCIGIGVCIAKIVSLLIE